MICVSELSEKYHGWVFLEAALTPNAAGKRWEWTLYAAILSNESKPVLKSFIIVLILAFQ